MGSYYFAFFTTCCVVAGNEPTLVFFEIHHPRDIAYTYKARLARDFGGIFDYFWNDVQLVASDPLLGCEPDKIYNADKIRGNMVLMMRGECSFLQKAIAAQNVGARAAIIFNNERDDIDSQIDMVDDGTGRGPQVDIPVMWIGGKNGHMILHSMRESSAILSVPHNHTFTYPHNRTPWDLW
jgi:hypothetical protein